MRVILISIPVPPANFRALPMSTVEAHSLSLASVPAGSYRCERIDAVGQDAIRLKRLGICTGRLIELIGRGDPMVLQIGNSRVGLSRQLAETVKLTPTDDRLSS